jgi:hypothetical protein
MASKVINVLTWLEGQVLPLLAKCLQCGLGGAIATDACRSYGIPGLLGSLLLRKRPSILVIVDIAIPNCSSHVPHLELYPHHHGPLDVVGLREGSPPNAGTDIPDNGLDPTVTMVPVLGGRAAPPVKATISVDPAAGASVPVWAVVIIRGTTTMRAPAQSTIGASAPIWAAATAPLVVCGYPLRRLVSRCLRHQLELVIGAIIGGDRAADATAAQSRELYCHCTHYIHHHCCLYFYPCSYQFYHCCPCHRRCSLYRRSLMFLCHGNLSLLSVLRA